MAAFAKRLAWGGGWLPLSHSADRDAAANRAVLARAHAVVQKTNMHAVVDTG
jgi:hypothetical protein